MDVCCLILDDGRVVTVRVKPTARVAEMKDLVMRALVLHGDSSVLDLYAPQDLVQRIVGNEDEFVVHTTLCSLGDFEFDVPRGFMHPSDVIATYLKDVSRRPQAIHVLVDVNDVMETSVMWAMHPALRLSSVLAGDDMDPAPAPVRADCPRECLSFTDVTTERCKQLTAALGLHVSVERVNERPIPAQHFVIPFDMSARTAKASEQQHVKAYLESTIGAAAHRMRMCLEFVSAVPNLLSISDERLPFDLAGGADAVVVQDLQASTRQCLHHLQGLRVVVDIKRDVDDSYATYEAQAIAKLLAANLLRPDAFVAVLLTNLHDVWTLLWLSPERRVTIVTMTSASDSVRAIAHWLTKRAHNTNFHLPYVGNCTRATLSTLLTQLSSSSSKRTSDSAADDDSDVPARVVKRVRTEETARALL